MLIQRIYKFRLKPTAEQESWFVFFAGCRRFVWNWSLRTFGEKFRYHDAAIALTEFKHTQEGAFLREAVAQSLQQVLKDLERAFVNRRERRATWPCWKNRHTTPHSFRFPQDVRLEGQRVVLPKIGSVALIQHRQVEGEIKSATIKQTPGGHWNITLTAHCEVEERPPTQDNPVGLDVGLETFVTTSDGEKVQPPKFYRTQETKIKRMQRQVSHKRKGSQNRAKARSRLSSVYEKVRHRRLDFIHQWTHRLVDRYDVICIEDLNISALTKTKLKGHAKSWLDATHAEFRRQLEYKARWRSKRVVIVRRFFASSQICTDCGFQERHDLSVRRWTCTCCQTEHDRDVTAARNLKLKD